MEPNPTPRLPSVSHIGLHSLQRDQNARQNTGGLQHEASQRLPYPHNSYRPLLFSSQIPHYPTAGTYGSLGRDAAIAQGTCEESSSGKPPLVSQYLISSPRTMTRHSRVLPHLSEPGPVSPRSSYQDLTAQPRDLFSHTMPHSGNPGCTPTSRNVSALQDYNAVRTPAPPPPPPTPQYQPASSYPTIQELAADLYHDVRQTHRDYPAWPLPTCLLHEISRSWSRGALHHLASSIGPGGAGCDTLTAVAERVTEWLDLRDNWELREWLTRERNVAPVCSCDTGSFWRERQFKGASAIVCLQSSVIRKPMQGYDEGLQDSVGGQAHDPSQIV
ncbi:hypothetical protein LIA77_02640 [Sarocladium implicatum]|nr:hypothetical protein LIA77_02640 [Sarocladium implicatum]